MTRDGDGRPYLSVEAPDSAAVVDFLDAGATVTIKREKRAGRWVVSVGVRLDAGDGYTWTDLEHAFPCPVKKAAW